jgi:hypothetical protein
MRRLSLLGLVGLVAVLVAAAAMAASAFAVQPSNLPNTLPKAFTGKSEAQPFTTANKVTSNAQKRVAQAKKRRMNRR